MRFNGDYFYTATDLVNLLAKRDGRDLRNEAEEELLTAIEALVQDEREVAYDDGHSAGYEDGMEAETGYAYEDGQSGALDAIRAQRDRIVYSGLDQDLTTAEVLTKLEAEIERGQ